MSEAILQVNNLVKKIKVKTILDILALRWDKAIVLP